MEYSEEQRLHDSVGFVGLRAQATAVGLLQLSLELRRAGVIDEDAINRIKDAIAKDISLSCPRSQPKREFLSNIRSRLDRLFAGGHPVGDASMIAAPESVPPVAERH